jgi:hypothetical protein
MRIVDALREMTGFVGYLRPPMAVRQLGPSRAARLFAAGVLALLAAGPAAAQEAAPCEPGEGQAEVVGTVSDSATGTRLPGAVVLVAWADSGGEVASTDVEGLYRLCGVPTGRPVSLTSTFPARRAEASLTLPEGRSVVRIDFELGAWGPDAIDAIEVEPIDVQVESEAAEADRARGETGYRLTRENLVEHPATPVSDVLRYRVPGLSLRYDRSGCPSPVTRQGRALVVVDGVVFPDAGCVLRDLTIDDIESIEVLSAVAAGTRYGSITGGGVVEIKTRRRR